MEFEHHSAGDRQEAGGHTQHDHRRRDTGQGSRAHHTPHGDERIRERPHGEYRKIWIQAEDKGESKMNAELKELVKKHFNLVDATAKLSFGEIKSADGELTLTYEGEELAVELPIFVVTPDGNIPAPDGEHMLEGGIKIEVMDGVIKEISTETEEVSEEGIAEGEVEIDIAGKVCNYTKGDVILLP